MKNNIILIGYMGVGKSTIGKRMAEIAEYEFLDTDQWIEKKEGRSIPQIFAEKGEEYFRELETSCISQLLFEEKGKVIAAGGGLPIKEENRKILQQLGIVVYLKAEVATIYERVKGDKNRPLLQTPDLEGRIRTMLKERESFYAKAADLTITIENKSMEQVISEIPLSMLPGRKGKYV